MTFRKLLVVAVAVACIAMTVGSSAPRVMSSPTRSGILPRSFPAPYAADPEQFGNQAVTAYLAGIERAAEDAARNVAGAVEPVTTLPSSTVTKTAPTPAAISGCANPVVPEAIALRESGCDWGAINPGGCSGRSCVGFFQLDAGHFYPVSPWNPNVPGVCYGLGDWHSPDVQIACASRLGAGAWG